MLNRKPQINTNKFKTLAEMVGVLFIKKEIIVTITNPNPQPMSTIELFFNFMAIRNCRLMKQKTAKAQTPKIFQTIVLCLKNLKNALAL